MALPRQTGISVQSRADTTVIDLSAPGGVGGGPFPLEMFSTQSHSENLALLRAIVEAKFHSTPNDTDVPGSAILARLAARLRDAVVAEEVRLEGASTAVRWREWAAIGPERAEWSSALRFANEAWCDSWAGWSEDERIAAATELLSPFEPEPRQLEAFLAVAAAALAGVGAKKEREP